MQHKHLIAANLVHHSYFDFNYSSNDVEIFYQDIKNTRYIAFPGTKNLADWLTNSRFNLRRPLITPYQKEGYKGGVRIHQGYLEAYLEVHQKILDLAETDLLLCLIGHSSGGCPAQIAGVDINYRLKKRVEVVTFGSPACGNEAWAKSARQRIELTSYVNFLDLVPWIMPWNYHVAELKRNLNIYIDPHNTKNYVKSLKSLGCLKKWLD